MIGRAGAASAVLVLAMTAGCAAPAPDPTSLRSASASVGDGTPMMERYLVRASGPDGEQLVEVVRFAGSDRWSLRRVDEPPS